MYVHSFCTGDLAQVVVEGVRGGRKLGGRLGRVGAHGVTIWDW